MVEYIKSGNIKLLFCFAFYLAWWIVGFNPWRPICGLKSMERGTMERGTGFSFHAESPSRHGTGDGFFVPHRKPFSQAGIAEGQSGRNEKPVPCSIAEGQ
ncbi:MAG: hypothetical protein IKF14_02505 [Atopobiaceae bacterium]|nr:hypothetical protein [Atopobiaceae bacterium]